MQVIQVHVDKILWMDLTSTAAAINMPFENQDYSIRPTQWIRRPDRHHTVPSVIAAGHSQRRQEDVPEGVPGRAPRQADGLRQREHLQAHLHRAQRRLGKVPGGGGALRS